MNTREEYEILDAAIDNLSVKEIYMEMNIKFELNEYETANILRKLYQDSLVDFFVFCDRRIKIKLDESGFTTDSDINSVFLSQTETTFDRYSYLRKIFG